MARSRRGTDSLLALLALLILLLPYAVGVFGNDLPQLLPAEVRTYAPQYFAVLLVVMLAVMGALARLRRVMDDGGPRAYSRRLRWFNVALTLALGARGRARRARRPGRARAARAARATLGRRISVQPCGQERLVAGDQGGMLGARKSRVAP